MNKIGVRAHDYGRDAPEKLFARIAGDGWQCVQVAFPKCVEGVRNWADVTPGRVEAVRKALQVHHLSVAVLGAYTELGMVEEVQRKKAVSAFRAQLPVAKALGACCVGTETTSMAKQPGVCRQEALECLERSLAEILPDAESLGVTVAVEPVYYHTMATPELTRRVLDDLASPALRVILDPANLFSPQEAFRQRELWPRVFDAFGDKIVAVHIKGARLENGAPVSCLLEESQVDYRAIVDLLARSGIQPPLLREEAIPARAAGDQAFMRALAE